jgi:hypothetical protein
LAPLQTFAYTQSVLGGISLVLAPVATLLGAMMAGRQGHPDVAGFGVIFVIWGGLGVSAILQLIQTGTYLLGLGLFINSKAKMHLKFFEWFRILGPSVPDSTLLKWLRFYLNAGWIVHPLVIGYALSEWKRHSKPKRNGQNNDHHQN